MPDLLDIAKGEVEDHSHINKFGQSTNVDNGVDTDIWDRANSTHNQAVWLAPTVPQLHDVVSSNIGDATGGTGCRTIRLSGLDENWQPESEVISTNGITNVSTVNRYVRIFRMECLTFGSGETNTGYLTATGATDATVTAQINPSMGQTLMAIYTIPTGHTGYLTCYYAAFTKTGGGSNYSDITLVARKRPDLDGAGFVTKHVLAILGDGTSYFVHPPAPPFVFSGRTDLKIIGNGSANNLTVSAGFDIVLVKDS